MCKNQTDGTRALHIGRQCRATAAEVAAWRVAKAGLGGACGRMAEVSLLALERRSVYELAQFAAAQERRRAQVIS
jgi:hypothetical protein